MIDVSASVATALSTTVVTTFGAFGVGSAPRLSVILTFFDEEELRSVL